MSLAYNFVLCASKPLPMPQGRVKLKYIINVIMFKPMLATCLIIGKTFDYQPSY
jgi:hypothetical protein